MPRPSLSPHPLPCSPVREKPAHFLTPARDGGPIRVQLERILNSTTFTAAHRSQLFLRYIVEHALAHPDEALKEYNIALDVFGRSGYDPAINNTVRVEAGRLRSRLLEYYAGEGRADTLLIEVPRGAYRAVIRPRQPEVFPAERPLASAVAQRSRRPWAIAAAFVLGALLGYSAAH